MRISGKPEQWLAWLTGGDRRKWKEATLRVCPKSPGGWKWGLAPAVFGRCLSPFPPSLRRKMGTGTSKTRSQSPFFGSAPLLGQTLILGGLGPDDEVEIAPLVNALSSDRRELVFWSTVGLGGLGERAAAAIPDLARIAVHHHQFGVREAAVLALSKIGSRNSQAKAAVLSALDDSSPFVRRMALQALIDFATLSEQELARIEAMERDSDEAVSSWSEIALRNIRLKGRADA